MKLNAMTSVTGFFAFAGVAIRFTSKFIDNYFQGLDVKLKDFHFNALPSSWTRLILVFLTL